MERGACDQAFAGPMVPPHDLLQLTLDPHILFGEMLLGDADVPDPSFRCFSRAD